MNSSKSETSECVDYPVRELPISPAVNMLSVDVECWHQIIGRQLTGRLMPVSEQTVRSTREVLALLSATGVKATFFILGYVAEAFPELVRQIDAEGHEVASHGYTHTRLVDLKPDQFRREIHDSVELLTRITGKPVLGFRAPEFSVVTSTFWALDILAQEGFRYDSSVFPISGRRYGVSGFSRKVVCIETVNGPLIEVPLSTVRGMGRNWPVAGGGYLRLLPHGLMRRAIACVRDQGSPFVLYVHPYELGSIALSCREFRSVGNVKRTLWLDIRWNLFRRTMRQKLQRLLKEFKFSSIREVLNGFL